jgi:hypothetical protein
VAELETAYGSFSQLIGIESVLRVPEYQRPYVWKPKGEIRDLWEDIVELYFHELSGGRGDVHFIGSIILGTPTPSRLSKPIAPIIDGQQRLITLSILIAAIRDLFLEAQVATDVTSNYLLFPAKRRQHQRMRIEPGGSDRRAYSEVVLGKDFSEKTGRVKRAYNYFRKQLLAGPIEPDEEDGPQWSSDDNASGVRGTSGLAEAGWDLELLLEVICERLMIVSIENVPAEQAFAIFHSMNSQGLALNQVDLVRNGVFMLLPKSGRTVYEDYWEPMEAVLGREDLQGFLHTWAIQRGYNIPVRETYRSIMLELSSTGHNDASVRDVVEQMYDDTWLYLLIARPDDKASRRDLALPSAPPFLEGTVLRQWLRRMAEWRSAPMRPVLMILLSAARSGELGQRDLTRGLLDLESFLVRRFIHAVPPNDLRSVFARIASELDEIPGVDLADRLREHLLEPTRRWPTDPQLADAFARVPLYGRNNRLAFFVLRRLAEAIEGGKEYPNIHYGTAAGEYSIEHVLPQDMSLWISDLRRWKVKNPAEFFANYGDTIGNLTITTYNSELSRKRFVDKKKYLMQTSKLKMTRQIFARRNEWTPSEVVKRGQDLEIVARKLWPRPAE